MLEQKIQREKQTTGSRSLTARVGSRLGLKVQSFSTVEITSSKRELRLCLLRSTCCCIRVINCSRSSSPITCCYISAKNRGDARHHCHLAGLNNGLCFADDLRAFLCYLLQPLTLLFGSERQEINLAQLIPATILKLANASA